MSRVTTSDVNHASWLAASGVAFVSADASRPPRVTFAFDDPEGRADALLGAFVRNDVLMQFTVWRGRFTYTLRVLRETRKTTLRADELETLRLPRR